MSRVENQNIEKTGELQPRKKALLFCMQGFVERYLGEGWSVCWVDRRDVRGFIEEDSKKIYIATGLADSQHIEIDKWAVREFRRNRGEIREILKECGY